jgi:hypothetical protein
VRGGVALRGRCDDAANLVALTSPVRMGGAIFILSIYFRSSTYSAMPERATAVSAARQVSSGAVHVLVTARRVSRHLTERQSQRLW